MINEFNSNFEIIRIIQSKKINIQNNEWIIEKPIITKDNISSGMKYVLFGNIFFLFRKCINSMNL